MKIEKNALNEAYRQVYDLIGEKAFMAFYNAVRGSQVTYGMHLYDSNKVANRLVDEFNGSNIDELAVKYGYSRRWVSNTVKAIEK